jgi:hypothetical protein
LKLAISIYLLCLVSVFISPKRRSSLAKCSNLPEPGAPSILNVEEPTNAEVLFAGSRVFRQETRFPWKLSAALKSFAFGILKIIENRLVTLRDFYY